MGISIGGVDVGNIPDLLDDVLGDIPNRREGPTDCFPPDLEERLNPEFGPTDCFPPNLIDTLKQR